MAKYALSNKRLKICLQSGTIHTKCGRKARQINTTMLYLHVARDLADSPELGRNYQKISPELLGYKSGHHIIFYRTINPRSIEITRILHERMDLENRIQE